MQTESYYGVVMANNTIFALRGTNPTKEMSVCLMIDGEVEWFASETAAKVAAEQALRDAENEDYTANVFILRSVWQNDAAEAK